MTETGVAIAAAVASNTGDDTVRSYIHRARVETVGGITLAANATPTFEAFTVGGSVARGNTNSVALAGAASVNSVDTDVQAFIKDSHDSNPLDVRGVNATAGGIALTAVDSTQAFAQAGAVSIAWQNNDRFQKQGRSLSVGVSIALNLLGSEGDTKTAWAGIDKSTVTAGMPSGCGRRRTAGTTRWPWAARSPGRAGRASSRTASRWWAPRRVRSPPMSSTARSWRMSNPGARSPAAAAACPWRPRIRRSCCGRTRSESAWRTRRVPLPAPRPVRSVWGSASPATSRGTRSGPPSTERRCRRAMASA